MNFIEKFINFINGKISDEEVDSNDWVLCPKCSVNVLRQDLLDNNLKCPNCSTFIENIN